MDTSDKKVQRNTEKTKTRAYRSEKLEKTTEKSIEESESQKVYT